MHFPEKDKIFSELTKLLLKPTKIVVGVSGGPDSRLTFAILSDFYKQNSRNQDLLIVAHFNHGQRKESDKEQQQIFHWYENYNIYYNDKKPIKGLKETALRDARHAFFQEVCQKEKAIYLATGHNLDDRIETSFINLLRGTSLQGLSNMRFSSHKKGLFHICPAIGLRKRHIQELCDKNKIDYFDDPTNQDSTLTIRNRLRNDIFPQIIGLVPNAKWYESRETIYKQIEERLLPHSDKMRIVPAIEHPSRNAKHAYEIILSEPNKHFTEADWLFIFQQLGIRKNVSQKTLAERIRFSSNSADGYKFLAGFYFFISHGKIFAIDGSPEFWEKQYHSSEKVPPRGKMMKFGGETLAIKSTRRGGVIRYTKPGDSYKGKRVKKRMINQKIPLFRRNLVPVVEKNGKIIDVIKDVVPAFYMK